MSVVRVVIEAPDGESTVEVCTDGPNAGLGTAIDFLKGESGTPAHRIKSLSFDRDKKSF